MKGTMEVAHSKKQWTTMKKIVIMTKKKIK